MRQDRRAFLLGSVTTAAVVFAGCSGEGGGSNPNVPTLDPEPSYQGWFSGVSNYNGTYDYRDQNRVRVRVGVRGGIGFYKFGPAAIAVSPGTEVVWEWTGHGGAHDVQAENGAFDSGAPVRSESKTFAHTFETPRIYRYFCSPHRGQGMKGAVFVALSG